MRNISGGAGRRDRELSLEGIYDAFSNLMKKMLWNPHLKAVRNGLTLTLPLVMAGCVAVLIANFPLPFYQDLMRRTFGENWRTLSIHIADGTFSILSIIMLLTISFSLAEYYNSTHRTRETHPAMAALVSLASLIALIQPYSFSSEAAPDGGGIPFFWLGIHGLFLAIFVAFVSTVLFFRLRRISWLNISFYSEEADASISYAFSAMFPGMITIMVFALFKTILTGLGIESLHQSIYDLLSAPFARLGNTFGAALFYTFIRHLFWFFGIHGTNLMEPVTTSIYVPAMEENMAAVALGQVPPNIFTKTFFDAFIAMGGSGSTLCLILAIFIYSRRGTMRKIAQISLLPALFNINEMIMFGLPMVLNPIFLIPFMLVPLLQCVVTYFAMYWGLVPYTIVEIGWTAPPFISGYAATGNSTAGVAMQFFNLILGAAVYLPFVRIAAAMKREAFNQAFRELMPGYAESIGDSDYVISGEARALSRSLTNDLSEAIARKELSLEYQPQVDSLTGKVFGVEALMRWDHSHLGRIPPGLFITLAEESGLIKSLGAWALEESCAQLDRWRRQGVTDVTMSVNLSVYQLADDEILEEIGSRVRRYGIPKGALEVEVTESAALSGDDRTALLDKIHSLGVAIAIDDFGMGHSSLVYLKQFPVDTLKIDRVLSKDVVTSRSSSEIISTIAELCRSLKIHLLVEYVDEVEQLKVLQALGCTRIQGWLYSPSLPADKCLEFIKKGTPVY